MLRLLTDLPDYRARHSSKRALVQTWFSDHSEELNNTSFNSCISTYQKSLERHGVGRGDRVVTISAFGHGRLLAAEFAALRLGAVLVPVHAGLPAEDRQYILNEIHPVLTIVTDHHEAEILHSMEHTGGILLIDKIVGSTVSAETTPVLCSPEDAALIIYTSGSMGTPKGIQLSHANVISSILSALAVIPVTENHAVLSYLPSAHIFERIAIYCYLATGANIHFAEPRQGMALMRTIHPHYITAVPRILDSAIQRFLQAGESRHYVIRSTIRWALDTEAPPGVFRSLCRTFILSFLKRSFGRRLRGILVGGAALSPATEQLFRNARIKVRTGYGLSECCGVATVNRFEPGGNKYGTVGLPLPGVEVRIDKSDELPYGEILIRSAGVMMAYYRRPEETKAAITADGWLRTGDAGEWVNGRFLRLTGRIREHFKNAYGEYVSPVKLEQLLEADPWILRVLIVGAGMPYTAALILPDFDLVEAWCREHRVHWTAPLYMVHNTEVQHAFDQHLSKINKSIAPHEQIRRFRLLADQWTVQNGRLTPALKLRREVLLEHYQKEIRELYE